MSTQHDWRRNAALTFASLPLSIWAERTYQAMPRLDAHAAAGPLPALSIIIPARNEARNLSRLLPSLQQLRYPGPLELIVVDDGSSDGTGQVAAAHGAQGAAHRPSARRLEGQAARLPPGRAGGDGRLAAVHRRRHLCTSPTARRSAVDYAVQRQLDGLSLFLKQESKAWIDRLALTAAYAGLFAGTRPQDRLFNGQYVLLRRDVY